MAAGELRRGQGNGVDVTCRIVGDITGAEAGEVDPGLDGALGHMAGGEAGSPQQALGDRHLDVGLGQLHPDADEVAHRLDAVDDRLRRHYRDLRRAGGQQGRDGVGDAAERQPGGENQHGNQRSGDDRQDDHDASAAPAAAPLPGNGLLLRGGAAHDHTPCGAGRHFRQRGRHGSRG